jgi:hypothetical protein
MSNKPFNCLTNAELERLALLSEELGEVQQAIGKILRHGYESKYSGRTNRQDLEYEIGLIEVAINLLKMVGDIDGCVIVDSECTKSSEIGQYLHYNKRHFPK